MSNRLRIVPQVQFKKDLKNAENRGKKLNKLAFIIAKLQRKTPLSLQNRNHKLKGNYAYCGECPIEPDWLLIYQITEEELLLIRTGPHSDLF